MPDDPIIRPLIGVHVLTEFVFCKRAGLVCHVEGKTDTGVELSVSNLDYMPFYELKEIDLALAELQRKAVWLGGINDCLGNCDNADPENYTCDCRLVPSSSTECYCHATAKAPGP